MRRLLSSAVLLAVSVVGLAAAGQAPPQLPAETPQQKEARLQWWTEARFGMFIHWGSTRCRRATSG